MLLFPDLRALEGVLRAVLCSFDMHTDQEEHGFGAFFDIHKSKGAAIIKSSYVENVGISGVVQPLERAYTFFRKHRHSLFHMSDFADASRKIDTLEKALSLSKDVYALLNDIYRAINTNT